MTKKAIWAVCGTVTIISATVLSVVWGGGVQVAGLLITGLAMLLASVDPPRPPKEGGQAWPR